MNIHQQSQWLFKTLGIVLEAFGKNPALNEGLVYKGAFILNHYLPTQRKSLDIDSNLAGDFGSKYSSREQAISFLTTNATSAIRSYIEQQNPIRYEFEGIRVDPRNKTPHPRGWDGYVIKINITDNELAGVRVLPAMTIDVAAPEPLLRSSINEIQFGSSIIKAYSIERIAGEKARAFLSSLPTYRSKIAGDERTTRLKDLYDLARIYRETPISNVAFWKHAGLEFQLACKSRLVDCAGAESFQEDWAKTRKYYSETPTLPTDIGFEEVESVILAITRFWREMEILPFAFPL